MDINELILQMRKNAIFAVERGSVVYGTVNGNSDVDVLAIVPDEHQDFLSEYENGILRANDVSTYLSKDEDWEFISISNFKKQVQDCTVLAMETLFTPVENIIYKKNCDVQIDFKIDKWKVRQQFSGTASNSWAKAHKKMTVEKDLDMYRGVKSLFHSLRILMFANQLCEHEIIVNFKEAKDIWLEIYMEYLDGKQWDYFKEKYRPVYNELRSKLAILAPKPISQ